jgi:hypothetical protein
MLKSGVCFLEFELGPWYWVFGACDLVFGAWFLEFGT